MSADVSAVDRPAEAVGPIALPVRPWRPSRWMREVAWRHIVAVLACFFALFPVIWVVSASINPTGSIAAQQLIPREPTLDNFRELLNETSYTQWLLNSVMIAGVASALQVALGAHAAYAFSRLRFHGRRAGLVAILLIQMFPQLLAVVAIFLMMNNIGDVFPQIGLGTQAGVILVYLGGALSINTWMMKGFFDTIPRELDETAKVDGASHAQIFYLVVLPLVRPVLAVIGLLAFVFAFNEFIIASALLQGSDAETLPIGLFTFIDERYGSRWGPFAAGALMGGVPIIVLFLFLQRYIISGLTAGSVKG